MALHPRATGGYCKLSSMVAAKGERIARTCSSVGLVVVSTYVGTYVSK